MLSLAALRRPPVWSDWFPTSNKHSRGRPVPFSSPDTQRRTGRIHQLCCYHSPAMNVFRSHHYKRIIASVPLLVTVIVHILLGIAGYYIVTEQIIGKKRVFDAAPLSESIAQKQVEHRLQIARKGGGSSSASPVTPSRIFSAASDALQVPSLPDLPKMGSSSLNGMGFGKGMGAVGTGTGYNTGLGTSSGLGRGFMSTSFLGVSTQRASRIVFIVDVGRDLLDIRKGGFEAFTIIREEMMKLINRLPPQATFGVVLYESGRWSDRSVAAFNLKLAPANVAQKTEFFEWLRPVNATPDRIGISSADPRRIEWTPKPLSNAGINTTGWEIPGWAQALHFALEMEPDTVYIVAGSQGRFRKRASEAELTRRQRAFEARDAALIRDGIDPAQVNIARERAFAKARAELEVINAQLRAKGKQPFVILDSRRIYDSDFQAALKKAGFTIPLDYTGWTDKTGKPIFFHGVVDHEAIPFEELTTHVAKLQRALVRDRATINFFLFVGPDEKPETAMENLGKIASRNGGRFELITTRRLQELSARTE